MVAADGVEPTYPGSEPGALPMCYAAIWCGTRGLNPHETCSPGLKPGVYSSSTTPADS